MPKTRAGYSSSGFAAVGAQQPAQALVAPNWAFAGQRIELGPDELVLQSLMIPLLEMTSATPYGRSLSR